MGRGDGGAACAGGGIGSAWRRRLLLQQGRTTALACGRPGRPSAASCCLSGRLGRQASHKTVDSGSFKQMNALTAGGVLLWSWMSDSSLWCVQ